MPPLGWWGWSFTVTRHIKYLHPIVLGKTPRANNSFQNHVYFVFNNKRRFWTFNCGMNAKERYTNHSEIKFPTRRTIPRINLLRQDCFCEANIYFTFFNIPFFAKCLLNSSASLQIFELILRHSDTETGECLFGGVQFWQNFKYIVYNKFGCVLYYNFEQNNSVDSYVEFAFPDVK